MLSFPDPAVYQGSKCFFTHGVMPHLDPAQLPSKGKPWTAISSLDFIHKVDLILPQELYETIRESLVENTPSPQFLRVIMPLGEIVSGDFFREYVKLGDILMFSEGKIGVDNVFTLRNGTLNMFLDKETYERAGLVGKPYGPKGDRGRKPRWVVEFDLRSTSMVPGKKGFDRLAYACKNVLQQPLTWLFCNAATTYPDPDPLAAHFPTKYTSTPAVAENISALAPPLKLTTTSTTPGQREAYEGFATEMYEWIALLRLHSPRVESGDKVDPYLCRYQVPGEREQQRETKLCRVTWEGLLSASWARKTLVDLILALPLGAWFSFSVNAFPTAMMTDGSECTFLRLLESHGEYVMWEIKGHE